MSHSATNRRALEDHLDQYDAELTINEEPTGLDGWSFFQTRMPRDRQDPTNWAVRHGEVITDAEEGLRLLGHDLAAPRSLPSADDLAIAVVSIRCEQGSALTTERLTHKPFWHRWRHRPRVTRRNNEVTVRCIVTYTGRGETDEVLVIAMRA